MTEASDDKNKSTDERTLHIIQNIETIMEEFIHGFEYKMRYHINSVKDGGFLVEIEITDFPNINRMHNYRQTGSVEEIITQSNEAISLFKCLDMQKIKAQPYQESDRIGIQFELPADGDLERLKTLPLIAAAFAINKSLKELKDSVDFKKPGRLGILVTALEHEFGITASPETMAELRKAVVGEKTAAVVNEKKQGSARSRGGKKTPPSPDISENS